MLLVALVDRPSVKPPPPLLAPLEYSESGGGRGTETVLSCGGFDRPKADADADADANDGAS